MSSEVRLRSKNDIEKVLFKNIATACSFKRVKESFVKKSLTRWQKSIPNLCLSIPFVRVMEEPEDCLRS